MQLIYRQSESSVKPCLIDTASSKTMVYIRKNITKRQTDDGIKYVYDETTLTKEQYKEYLAELNLKDIEQQRADIDYIAFMTGIDLEENHE